ncbi:hypothetical protein FRX31_034266 [Thalictrum thalictroides]|uniref:Uncharacterized protein n=1 Tax=Thalictrum thalictroides TaxID=46969 RepID=A0A7J6UV72_THATH|nr:hypothetical protein FRX31_034266 [Thalictrum thalictroides]
MIYGNSDEQPLHLLDCLHKKLVGRYEPPTTYYSNWNFCKFKRSVKDLRQPSTAIQIICSVKDLKAAWTVFKISYTISSQ